MCCGSGLAGTGSAGSAGSVTVAVRVDGLAGGCMLVPWLLACVWQVPMTAAVSGELRVVHEATLK